MVSVAFNHKFGKESVQSWVVNKYKGGLSCFFLFFLIKGIIKVIKKSLPIRDFFSCLHMQSLTTATKTLYVSSKAIPSTLSSINSTFLAFLHFKQINKYQLVFKEKSA